MAALISAARPHNSLACGLLFLAGQTAGGAATGTRTWIGALAVGLLCAASHLVNDLVDLPADRLNRPGRPLPARRLGPHLVRRAAGAVWLSGLFLGLSAMPRGWFWWLGWAALGVGYSLLAKGRPLIAPVWTALVIATVWLAGAARGGLTGSEAAVFGVLVWFLVFREVVKGLEDTCGDLCAGYGAMAGRFPGRRAGLLLLAVPLAGLSVMLLGGTGGVVVRLLGGVFLVCLALSVVIMLAGRPARWPSAGAVLKVGAFMGVGLLFFSSP